MLPSCQIEGQPSAEVAARDKHDQAQVALDQPSPERAHHLQPGARARCVFGVERVVRRGQLAQAALPASSRCAADLFQRREQLMVGVSRKCIAPATRQLFGQESKRLIGSAFPAVSAQLRDQKQNSRQLGAEVLQFRAEDQGSLCFVTPGAPSTG
jgi:hypothetical protein